MPRTFCKTDGHFLKRLNRATIGFSNSLWFVASNGNSCPHISKNTSVHRGEDSSETDSMCRGGPGSYEPGLGLRLRSHPEPEWSFPLSPLCHPIKLRGTERFSASLISDLILYYFFPFYFPLGKFVFFSPLTLEIYFFNLQPLFEYKFPPKF